MDEMAFTMDKMAFFVNFLPVYQTVHAREDARPTENEDEEEFHFNFRLNIGL